VCVSVCVYIYCVLLLLVIARSDFKKFAENCKCTTMDNDDVDGDVEATKTKKPPASPAPTVTTIATLVVSNLTLLSVAVFLLLFCFDCDGLRKEREQSLHDVVALCKNALFPAPS